MNKKATRGKARLDPVVRLRGGHVTVRELTTFHPRLRTFTTKYAAQVRGVCLKTRRGFKFSTRAAALLAGRECMKANVPLSGVESAAERKG